MKDIFGFVVVGAILYNIFAFTVLVGVNNSGKTTFLCTIQLALGV